jgi:hypothetical protein
MRSFVLILFGVLSAALNPAFGHIDKAESLRNHYFVVVWGYEGNGNLPRESHTFVAFYNGEDFADGRVKPATISWLPTDGDISLIGAEKGRNFSLGETLAMACRANRRIARWGPYEVSLDLYRRAIARIKVLGSGRVAYSALGLAGSMNCIEAAGDITAVPFHPGISWGFRASETVVRHFAPFFKSGRGIDSRIAQLMLSNKCASQNVVATSR